MSSPSPTPTPPPPGGGVLVAPADEADRAAFFELVNAAYEVETGSTGVAFKRTKRLLAPDELDLSRGAFSARLPGGGGGGVVGLIVYDAAADEEGALRVHFGPFAVAPSAQGLGVGRALLARLEAWARQAGAASIDIEVVNHRADLFPYYAKLGFVQIGTAEFPSPERLTRPSHFVLLRRALVRAREAAAAAAASAGRAAAAAAADAAPGAITMTH